MLQSARKHVRPAVVPIRGGTVAVSNRIAQNHNAGRIGRSHDVDAGELVPVVEFFCVWEIRGRHKISMHQVGSSVGTWMTGLPGRRVLEVDADRQIAQRCDGIYD